MGISRAARFRSRAVRRSRLLLSLLAVGLLAGCGDFTDAPPDPSVAPLEIVANNQGRTACDLNRTEITEGTHEVVVITEGADAVVVVRDGSGAVLLEQRGNTFWQGSSGEAPSELSTSAAPQLTFKAGTYDVVCRYPNGAEGSNRLHVAP